MFCHTQPGFFSPGLGFQTTPGYEVMCSTIFSQFIWKKMHMLKNSKYMMMCKIFWNTSEDRMWKPMRILVNQYTIIQRYDTSMLKSFPMYSLPHFLISLLKCIYFVFCSQSNTYFWKRKQPAEWQIDTLLMRSISSVLLQHVFAGHVTTLPTKRLKLPLNNWS